MITIPLIVLGLALVLISFYNWLDSWKYPECFENPSDGVEIALRIWLMFLGALLISLGMIL